MHGGGFAYGDIDMPEADGVARRIAAQGFPVISVDYRLAPAFRDGTGERGPGWRFPAASDDVIAAWEWSILHASDVGVDPALLAIGGASAGGNLAAGATLRLLRDEKVLPALVVLAYPTLLAVQPPPGRELRAALDAHPEADSFGPQSVRSMYENYLGGPVDAAALAAVPGNATTADVAGHPPVLMINGEIDELRVSGEVYAGTLRAAGCDVEILFEPGTTHGHLNRLDEPEALRSLERITRRLSKLAH
jgi:acetyl esterase/lipase